MVSWLLTGAPEQRYWQNRETANVGLESSVGRAPARQSGVRRFKSRSSQFFFVHPNLSKKLYPVSFPCGLLHDIFYYYLVFIYKYFITFFRVREGNPIQKLAILGRWIHCTRLPSNFTFIHVHSCTISSFLDQNCNIILQLDFVSISIQITKN